MSILMRTCAGCDCGDTGHKGIVARKVWHGRFPFDRECTSAIAAEAPQIKYLSKNITVMLRSSASSSDDYWTNSTVGSAVPVHCEATGEFSHERSVRMVVNRLSGIRTLEECIELKEGPTYAGSCNVEGYSPATSATTAFDDILCGSPSFLIVPWADIFSLMDACDGEIKSFAPACAATLTFFGEYRTPAEIVAHYEGVDYNYTTDSSSTKQCDPSGDLVNPTTHEVGVATATVELTSTRIEIHIEIERSVDAASWMAIPGTTSPYGEKVRCELPTASHYHVRSTIDVIIELQTPYTGADLNADVDGLLSQRALTDMTDYAWHHGCIYPLIKYDEVDFAVSPDDFDHGDCAWVDPYASAPYGDAGNGYLGTILNGSGAVTEWFSPGPGIVPDGAYKDFKLLADSITPDGQALFACKYAEILADRQAHNWYRPCGSDRNLLDFLSNTRYPNAWPICGHLDVTAVANTTPIEVTHEAGALQTGDVVDISAGSAAGTDLTITVLSTTAFTIDGSTANGTTVGGAVVTNAASTSPPSESWNDSTAKGDYLILEYQWDSREVAIDPTVRENNALYGFEPRISDLTTTLGNITPGGVRVVCITPNGENFGATGDTIPFPSFASPLICDARYGSRWIAHVRQRMRNPINMTAITDYVEGRNSEPSGAPALPSFDNGGIQTDGCDWQNSEPHVCPYVNILTIAEITAYADAVVGSVYPVTEGVVAPPLYTCEAFDNDVP